MATFEDKLAGDKLHYYCSSSEGEDGEDEISSKDKADECSTTSNPTVEQPHISKTESYRPGVSSTNTGPKGVVQDWQRYKQLQAEKRADNEKKRIQMAKKFTMSTTTVLEDEARKKDEEIEAELSELMSEDFLQQFQKQRIAEMMMKCGQIKKFGKVLHLVSHTEFLEAVEKENKHIIIIIHIYDRNVAACINLNKCLDTLAVDYPTVKFGKICSSVAGMSRDFRSKGLPALLVYKGNTLIGNFVRVTDDLTEDFFPSDLESFLIENGIIVDKNLYS